jgi:hypothetical protein
VQNKECCLLGEAHTLKGSCFRFKISSTDHDSTSSNKACAVSISMIKLFTKSIRFSVINKSKHVRN